MSDDGRRHPTVATGRPTEPWADFRAALLDDGVLLATDVDGVYGRSATYESVADAIDRLVLRVGADQDALSVRFPPVMPWSNFVEERVPRVVPRPDGVDPHVPGRRARHHAELVHAAESGEDRAPLLESTDMVLCPAVCHPLYPTQSGTLPEGGRRSSRSTATASATSPAPTRSGCRPSASTTTSTSGPPRGHAPTATGGSTGASTCSADWGSTVESVVANDPFFGRPGRMLAANQRSEELKYEIVAPVFAEGRPTAISSSNCHLDHFSRPFAIDTADGRAGPHGLLRLRRRPDHAGPARPPRHRPGRLARRRPVPCCGPRRPAADPGPGRGPMTVGLPTC